LMELKVLAATALWVVVERDYPFATYYQNVDLQRLIQVHPRTVCVDPYSGPGGDPWTLEELGRLRRAGIRPVAYLTLGVVPRFHPDLFQRARELGLLGPEDPRWKGDYAVEFWDPRWQEVLAEKLASLRELGFEGVLFDVIDVWTSRWYVRWFEDVTGRSPDELRELVYRTLARLADVAHSLGMEVYVCAGAAIYDREFGAFVERHGIKVVTENVIATDNGTLQPAEAFMDALEVLMTLSRITDVYDVEYGLDLEDEEVKRRLTLLLGSTRVREVYVTSPAHDRLGVAVVPAGRSGRVGTAEARTGRGESSTAGSQRPHRGVPLIPVVPVGRRGKLRPAQSVHPRAGRRYNPSSRPACGEVPARG